MYRRSFHTLLTGILAAGLLTLLAIPAHAQDKGVPRAKQITDLEQQIAELTKRIADLRQTEETTPQKTTSVTQSPDWVKALAWRPIGPANMSGRIVDLAVNPADPSMYWVATASGGLLKTTNNGVTFTHQFDHEATVSLGAVAVAASDPNVVWVGTGENNPRNSVSYGDGVYKSTDGGATWKHMGLKKSFQIGDIVIHPKDPNTVYVAALGRLYGPSEERGLYKTTDGGATWNRVLHVDDKTGALEVKMHPTKPDTLLVALWERARDSFDTNDPAKRWGPGSGLYKTTDGGKNFTKITKGLPTTSSLGRIGLDFYLQSPDTVFAVVDCEKIGQGPPRKGRTDLDLGFLAFEMEDAVRIFRVTEGSAAEKAGIQQGDLVTAVGDKKIQTAAEIADLIREKKVGEKMKVTVTREGKPLTVETEVAQRQAPPGGAFGGGGGGRGGEPNRPYGAQLGGQGENLQDEQGPDGYQYGGIYKSTDAGDSWVRINSLNPRPMYFSKVRVDPNDEKNLWVLGVQIHRSVDSGKTFRTGGRGVHADNHVMWINPKDSRHMVVGCDGGVYVSYDKGANYDHLNHVAIGQFYHVAIDTRPNYYVYGGLQDNGSWGGPSRTKNQTGPINEDWISVGSGDGFTCRVDPNDPDQIYYTSQNGGFGRRNLRTGEAGRISPAGARGPGGFGGGPPPAAQPEQPPKGEAPGKPAPGSQTERARYRFNWNAPFILSHHNSKIYYCAGNQVFRSLDRGNDLRSISPEISLTDRGSATALSESPRNPNVLYVGTDDGAVWATKDGGTNWSNITKNFGLAGPRCVASIEASRAAEGRCYVAFDGHRQDDDNPLVYVTEDYGQTWKSVAANLPWGSTRVLREDVTNHNLLYCGTEFAAWASLDRGASWVKINNNLPTVAVHEIAIHPTAGEIVAATHGRSIWILDVTALRQMTEEVQKAGVHLFQPATAYNWRTDPNKGRTNRRFTGTNPPRGTQLTYKLGEKAEKVSLKIVDIDGRTVRELRASAEPGLHQVAWDLSRAPTRQVTGGSETTAGAPGATGQSSGRTGARTGGTRTGTGQGQPGGGRTGAGAAQAPPGGAQPAAGAPAQAGGGPGGGGFGGFGGGRGGFGGGVTVAPGVYRVVLTVDGKEFTRPVRVMADPSAPASILATDGEEDDGQ